MKLLNKLKRGFSKGNNKNNDDSARSQSNSSNNAEGQQHHQPRSSESLDASGEAKSVPGQHMNTAQPRKVELVEEVDVTLTGSGKEKVEISQQLSSVEDEVVEEKSDQALNNEQEEKEDVVDRDLDQVEEHHAAEEEKPLTQNMEPANKPEDEHQLEEEDDDDDEDSSTPLDESEADETETDMDNLDDLLANMDIDRDFQMFSSFRNSMTRRTSVQQTKSSDEPTALRGQQALASITEASPEEERLEAEDIEKWQRRLEREEVFSRRYRPSKEEKKELRELETLLGMRSVSSFMSSLMDSNVSPDQEAWKQLIHPDTKNKVPASLLLKRAPLLYKSSYDTEHEEHEAELILLTHGCVIATVVDTATNSQRYELHKESGDGLVGRRFERAFLWKSVVCVSPTEDEDDDEHCSFEMVIRGTKGQERLSFISGSHKQQQAWLEALEITTINFFMHEKNHPKDLGWQYRIVQKPAFTMAVTGIEDELGLSKHVLNHLDEYNGYAPLHYAIRLGHETIVQSMLEGKADPNLKDKDKLSPAFHAVQDEASESMLLLLERFGASGIDKAKIEKAELFQRVTATNSEREQRREAQQQQEALAAQAKMAENMRLLNERGQKIDEAADKARELNENAAEYGSLAAQLKEKTKKQANWNPFS